MRAIVLFVFTLLLCACAGGMSKNECLYADWRAIGYEDGAAGRDAGAIASRRAVCADKARVTPDIEAYRNGREDGLDEFCRPASAFDHGARGYAYAGACAGRDETAFVAAYERGAELHAHVSRFNSARSALANAHADLDRIDRDIVHAEAAIVSPATPHPARIDHLVALKHLTEERAKARAAVRDIAFDVDRAEAELEDYRDKIANHDARGAARADVARY